LARSPSCSASRSPACWLTASAHRLRAPRCPRSRYGQAARTATRSMTPRATAGTSANRCSQPGQISHGFRTRCPDGTGLRPAAWATGRSCGHRFCCTVRAHGIDLPIRGPGVRVPPSAPTSTPLPESREGPSMPLGAIPGATDAISHRTTPCSSAGRPTACPLDQGPVHVLGDRDGGLGDHPGHGGVLQPEAPPPEAVRVGRGKAHRQLP